MKSPLVSINQGEIIMDNNLVPGLTEQIKHLEDDIKTIKENNKFLFEKLDKAYGDRIELRAENYKLKEQVKNNNGTEEECLACSA
jgi:FtsZ-binding cell division protein ZapB